MKIMDSEKYLGYIKFEGARVVDGMMDARHQAEALLGVDAAVRHFVNKQAPTAKQLEFEIPVLVRAGSWEALIPETIVGWGAASFGLAATAYLTTSAKKMAENDFDSIGFTDLFRKSLTAIQWFLRIGKHTRDLSIKTFSSLQYRDNNFIVGIPNANGEYIYVPKYVFDLYVNANPLILKRLAALVEEDRSLAVGVLTKDGYEEETLDASERYIFEGTSEEPNDTDATVMPELEHGELVVLEGEVTRENKTTNSMGFKYSEHILTCHPDTGSIVPFKPLLFLRCRMYGYVNRHDENGRISSKKPKISFTKLEPLEDNSQPDLFADKTDT